MQQIPAFYFDRAAMARLADATRQPFRTAQPFQHIVIDEFVPREVIDLLIREFPGPGDIAWERHGPGRTQWEQDRVATKLANSDETRFGAFTRHFMTQLNSATFLAFLEDMTGLKGIIPDPSYASCGMHSTGRGGRLMMHTDVNRHPHGCQMHQYLNLILYLNDGWQEDWGGHLELWNSQRQLARRIAPVANRVVIFNTGTNSLHGHPHPLTCPPERRRNSFAVYYYLRDRPSSDEYTGMQRSVRWFASTDEDRAYAKKRTQEAVQRLAGVEGRAVGVTPVMIPFELPAGMVDRGSGHVPLYFLRNSDIGGASAFVQRHLRAACANLGLAAPEFLAAYRPIALLGVRSLAEAERGAPAMACLLDADGDVHVGRGPEHKDLVWVGYLDEILAAVPG